MAAGGCSISLRSLNLRLQEVVREIEKAGSRSGTTSEDVVITRCGEVQPEEHSDTKQESKPA